MSGDVWCQFLIDHKIRFFIRMRENMKVDILHKGEVKAFWLFHNLPLNTAYYYPKIVQVKGNWVYLSGMKYLNQKGNIEYLIVASFDKTTQTLEFYKQLKIKKHGRLEKSFFAYGLELFAQALLNAFQKIIHKFTLPFLSCI